MAAEGAGRAKLAARAGVVLAALGLSAAILDAGVANWLGRDHPGLAAQVAPHDARWAVAAAQAAVETGTSPGAPKVKARVDAALDRDLTQPSAVELRAVRADDAGDGKRATRLFELSSAISRRSLPTRLWLIQRSVDRGDVAGALEDFDIALRTSSNAPKVLFPVLARASGDPSLAAPLARLLDRPEDWRAMFLNYAVSEAHAGIGVSQVVLRMRDRRVIVDNHIDETLVAELIAEEDFALARRVQDAFHPMRASADLVRDPTFSNPALAYPFGWRLSEKGDAGAERSLIEGRPALAYQSLPGGVGQVATQLLTLAPGGYRLSTRTASAAKDGGAQPFWTLTCAEKDGPLITLLNQPTTSEVDGSIDFTVPAGCEAQWLGLNLRSADSPDQSGAIARVWVTQR
jgi:hypothetical protein